MIKRVAFLTFIFGALYFSSCNNAIETSLPPVPPEDSILVVNGGEYFINLQVGNTSMELVNRQNNVANAVFKQDLGSCFFGPGNETQFSSYFAYVSDTSRKEKIFFGLTNCVADSADGFSDSTYRVGSYPMEIPYPDTAVGFINYLDADSVFWSSSLGQGGFEAQLPHTFELTSVAANFDGYSALEVRGSFSGWVYNVDGDSLLVTSPAFFTKAWAL